MDRHSFLAVRLSLIFLTSRKITHELECTCVPSLWNCRAGWHLAAAEKQKMPQTALGVFLPWEDAPCPTRWVLANWQGGESHSPAAGTLLVPSVRERIALPLCPPLGWLGEMWREEVEFSHSSKAFVAKQSQSASPGAILSLPRTVQEEAGVLSGNSKALRALRLQHRSLPTSALLWADLQLVLLCKKSLQQLYALFLSWERDCYPDTNVIPVHGLRVKLNSLAMSGWKSPLGQNM